MTDEPKDPKAPSSSDDFKFEPLHDEEGDSSAEKNSSPSPEKPAPQPEAPGGPPVPPSPAAQWLAKNKTLALTLGFVLVAILMFTINKIRTSEPDDPEQTPAQAERLDEVPVNVMESRLGRFQDRIDAVGELKGEAEIELRFEVEGKIVALEVAEGDRVRQGQILARISDRDSVLKVTRAKNELEKMEKLFALGGVSGTKLEEARLNMEVAQTELDKTRLKANRDGIIGDKGAEVGEYVTPQRKIATLVSIKNVQVKVGIIEKQVDKVYPGQKILVTVDAYPSEVFEGEIRSISPIITGESKTFEITAKIPNPDSLLLPGMFARARIITYEAEDAISVPNDALVKAPNGFQVYVVDKDQAANVRDVEVGYVATEYTQILSGLSPGELVVVQKPPELKAGSKVKIIEVQN